MITRTISPVIERAATKYPIVTLTGPRQSGKTTFCREFFHGYTYVNLEELQLREFANRDPRGFFRSYPPPIVIDEIQNCPSLVSQIQVEADERRTNGEFVITGSQQIELLAAISQSLAGRTAIFTLLPFSCAELQGYGRSFSRNELILAGGMPRVYEYDIDPGEYYRNYISTHLERDVRGILNVKNFSRFETFLKLMAGRTGQLVNFSAMASDIGVSSTTLQEWATVLEAAHVIFRINPWHINLGKMLTKTPKYYFTDTGVVCSLLGITTVRHLEFHPMLGSLFENFVVVEKLKQKFNSGSPVSLYFYRTQKGSEIDIIEAQANILTPWEIKLSETLLKDFFRHLRLFRNDAQQSGYVCGTSERPGGIIYSGENIASYEGWQCVNYMNIS